MAQLNLLVGAIEKNVDQVIAAARKARDELDATAIIFPELTLTGYPPEDLLLRPAFIDAVSRGMDRLQSAVTGIDMIVGYPGYRDDALYNCAAVLRDGECIADYRKQCLPNYSVFDEKRYFEPGDEPCVVEMGGLPVGLTICEDIWSAEPVGQAVDAGARLIINLNASPYHVNKGNEREVILSARAREAGLPILYVNLVGGQDELVFDGESLVVNGSGDVTHRFPAFDAGLYPVDIFANGRAEPVTGTLAPVLEEDESVYRALVLGVRDYIGKNRFKGAVLGLSGGIDSALTLAIAADAIGAERLRAIMMPSRYTAQMSLDDAASEAALLGVQYETISIEPMFAAVLASLAPVLAGTAPDTTEENLQARIRGMLLMALSNKEGRILLTTGNKSETSVGYATLYGDMAGGFAPLKDVPKQLVYRLARYRNLQAQVIPERVLTRPPSAELADDQKDADSLPPYDILDAILERYVEQDQDINDIVAAGFERETVTRVTRLVDHNEYKRRQAPPGVRITRRAFGRDRRYPITSGYNGG